MAGGRCVALAISRGVPTTAARVPSLVMDNVALPLPLPTSHTTDYSILSIVYRPGLMPWAKVYSI
jgi:hypothetical protein